MTYGEEHSSGSHKESGSSGSWSYCSRRCPSFGQQCFRTGGARSHKGGFFSWIQTTENDDFRCIDLDHDAADLDRKLSCPVLALWAEQGVMHRLFNVLDTWRERASNGNGKPLPGGH